jgi:hypothetical protein
MMFPDTDILERRLRQLERLPWPIPAAVIMCMTEADLDALDMAKQDEWWRILNTIVTRRQPINDREETHEGQNDRTPEEVDDASRPSSTALIKTPSRST